MNFSFEFAQLVAWSADFTIYNLILPPKRIGSNPFIFGDLTFEISNFDFLI